MKNRLSYIDIAKGLGILLVVLGHNELIKNTASERYIFSFHMPLFIFLSGWVFNDQYSLKTLIVKRSRSILAPYFAAIFFFLAIYLAAGKIHDWAAISNYLIKAAYSSGPNIDVAALWFLTSIYLTQIAFRVIYVGQIGKIEHWAIRWLIMMAVLWTGLRIIAIHEIVRAPFVSGVFNSKIIGLPWSADLLLITLFYFALGYEASKVIRTLSRRGIIFSFLISLIAFLMLHLKFDCQLDLNLRVYDSFSVSTLEAILGIIMTMALAMLIEHVPAEWLKKPLIYDGQLTIIILIFHSTSKTWHISTWQRSREITRASCSYYRFLPEWRGQCCCMKSSCQGPHAPTRSGASCGILPLHGSTADRKSNSPTDLMAILFRKGEI